MSVSLSLFIVLCTVALILLYVSYTQYRRAEKALDVANVLLANMEHIQDYIKEASSTLADPKLKAAFEADDEVGTFFKQIIAIQEVLDEFVPKNEETSTDVQ